MEPRILVLNFILLVAYLFLDKLPIKTEFIMAVKVEKRNGRVKRKITFIEEGNGNERESLWSWKRQGNFIYKKKVNISGKKNSLK